MYGVETPRLCRGRCHVQGTAEGSVLSSDVELSFFGGVDPATGEIVDRHHPLSGKILTGTILVIPGGRGSCSGSAVMLELLLNGRGPKAVVFERDDDILALGVVVAEELFGVSIPVVVLDRDDFKAVQQSGFVRICDETIAVGGADLLGPVGGTPALPMTSVALSERDLDLLEGSGRRAASVAMRIITRVAEIQRAPRLVDVSQAHVDACIYTGPGSLMFAEKMRDWGGRVAVPTTLNSISVDRQRWRAQGIDPSLAVPSAKLADIYVELGASPTFTCAPYLLDPTPDFGASIAWSESNAVAFANSVLGARTLKYPDFLDVAVALTGRAPFSGPYLDTNRKAALRINVAEISKPDDAYFPLLGYSVGAISGNRIPVVTGLEHLSVDFDDLKGFAAAFATVSSAPMFHIVGVTPEAAAAANIADGDTTVPLVELERQHLAADWAELNTSMERKVDLISLGNPHFSLTEMRRLASLCRGKRKNENVAFVVTTSRAVYNSAANEGLILPLEDFGVRVITDTCWCMITEPIIPTAARTIMTNSGKYAHYGPGLTGRKFHFGSLAACVDAACSGENDNALPNWLATSMT